MKKYYKIGIVIGVLMLGFFYYYQSRIVIWRFNLSKNDLKNVLISTKENTYMVTDSRIVLELSEEVSKMERLNKIEVYNWPPRDYNSPKYNKINIQLKNNVTYGGSFWQNGDEIIMDSNGYYWRVPKGFFELIDKSIKGAKIIN